jgi:RNA recognition motif-containing protein
MYIYVGNLARQTTEEGLACFFQQYGRVESVVMPRDKITSTPQGFAVVEMPDNDQAQRAIEQLNRKELDGRVLIAAEARHRAEQRRIPRKYCEQVDAAGVDIIVF